MDLRSLLEGYGELSCLETVSPRWGESLESMPDGRPWFLEQAYLSRACTRVGIDAEVERTLQETADTVAGTPELAALAWHLHLSVFEYLDLPWTIFGKWPRLDSALSEHAPAFYLLISLGMVELTEARHRELGIPPEITAQTVGEPRVFLDRYTAGSLRRESRSVPGLFRRELGWLRHYTAGDLYRIGRFEYMPMEFNDPVHVFRNLETGTTIALAADGNSYTAAGYCDPGPGESNVPVWRARLAVEGESVTGTPISPLGHALNREITLDRRRFREVLAPGASQVLDVHIPGGGRMNPDAVRSSLHDAVAFFCRTFPERPFSAFRCESWILGPQLEKIFAPDSNLVSFMRELYLFPVPSNPLDGLFFVFSDDEIEEGDPDADRIAALSCRTTLQRKVREYLLTGGSWRAGGMFLLFDDLDRFGSAVYRSQGDLAARMAESR